MRRYAEVWRAVEVENASQEELEKRYGGSMALEWVMMVQIKRAKGEID